MCPSNFSINILHISLSRYLFRTSLIHVVTLLSFAHILFPIVFRFGTLTPFLEVPQYMVKPKKLNVALFLRLRSNLTIFVFSSFSFRLNFSRRLPRAPLIRIASFSYSQATTKRVDQRNFPASLSQNGA